MNVRLAHICPILPARHGNGLAMRASVFSDAAALLGKTLIIAIDGHQGDIADHSINGACAVGIDGRSRPDTRLMLISKATVPEQKAVLLRQYGRPSASVILSLPVMQETVRRLKQHRPDVILISRAYLLPLVDELKAAFPNVPLVVDLDDDDGALHRSYAQQARAQNENAECLWHEAEADVADSVIAHAMHQVAAFTCASDVAAASLLRRLEFSGLQVVPNAVPETVAVPEPSSAGTDLLFLGNLSYRPNIDGLRWFVTEVWPDLSVRFRDIRLIVAGSNPGGAVKQLCSGTGIELVADPDHVAPLYQRAAATVVPLRFGSGSRIKILEAGQYRLPVITTKKGAEGLRLDAGKHAYISATGTDELLAACINCLSDRPAARQRADALHSFVQKHHDRQTIVRDMGNLLLATLKPDHAKP